MAAPAELCLLTCLALTVGLTLGWGPDKDVEFTFLLPAGDTECFFQPTESNGRMEIDYQVIAGSGMDVGFSIISPQGSRVVSDFRKSDGIHIVSPTDDGDYRLCFDNSFSKLSEKMVFFRVITENQDFASGDQNEWADLGGPESLVDYKLEDIRATMDSLYLNMDKSRVILNKLRAFETRDRYLLEDNLWRVSFWSCLSLLVMLTVAVTQIYTLRRLFDDKRHVHT